MKDGNRAWLAFGVVALAAGVSAVWNSGTGSWAKEPWDPMEDPLIRQHARGPGPAEVLFHASTRGGKYEILAFADGVDNAGIYRPRGTRMYRIEERSSGRPQGSSSGLTQEDLVTSLRRRLADASQYSGIHYEVRLDGLETGIPPAGYR